MIDLGFVLHVAIDPYKFSVHGIPVYPGSEWWKLETLFGDLLLIYYSTAISLIILRSFKYLL